jgi:hypothetical protein
MSSLEVGISGSRTRRCNFCNSRWNGRQERCRCRCRRQSLSDLVMGVTAAAASDDDSNDNENAETTTWHQDENVMIDVSALAEDMRRQVRTYVAAHHGNHQHSHSQQQPPTRPIRMVGILADRGGRCANNDAPTAPTEILSKREPVSVNPGIHGAEQSHKVAVNLNPASSENSDTSLTTSHKDPIGKSFRSDLA